MEELIRLTRENNEMLKKLCAYVEKVESPQYAEQRQLTSFLINCAANSIAEMKERMQQRNDNNQQTFWR